MFFFFLLLCLRIAWLNFIKESNTRGSAIQIIINKQKIKFEYLLVFFDFFVTKMESLKSQHSDSENFPSWLEVEIVKLSMTFLKDWPFKFYQRKRK